MRRIAFLLLCLACASHGRRVQSSSEPAETRQAHLRSTSLKALEMLLSSTSSAGFNPSGQGLRTSRKKTSAAVTHAMLPPTDISSGHVAALAAGLALYSAVEPALAKTYYPIVGDIGWIEPVRVFFATLSSIVGFFFLVRTVLSWFPSYNLNDYPWVLVASPTEPLLIPLRKVFPPIQGIDASPLAAFAIVTFFNEIVVSEQGLLKTLLVTGGY